MSATVLVRAHREGRLAAQAGQPLTACPHKLDAETTLERVLARMWMRGHERADPFPVDYSG